MQRGACTHERLVEYVDAQFPQASVEPDRMLYERWCLCCGVHERRVVYPNVSPSVARWPLPAFTALIRKPCRAFGFEREKPPDGLLDLYRAHLERGRVAWFDANGEWCGPDDHIVLGED